MSITLHSIHTCAHVRVGARWCAHVCVYNCVYARMCVRAYVHRQTTHRQEQSQCNQLVRAYLRRRNGGRAGVS